MPGQPRPLDIDVDRSGPVAVVALRGPLDLQVSQGALAALTELIASGAHRMVLDLEAVPHVDSSGLRVVVIAVKRLRGLGGDLAVCALAPAVRAVFELTQLTRLVQIHATRSEATAALQRPS